MPNKRVKISAFGSAITAESVTAEIDVDDVRLVEPTWTRERAAAFLRKHGDEIGRAMVTHGVMVLAAAVRGESNAD